jgi:hypothetical protein
MVGGQRELSLDVSVAPVAQFRLRFDQLTVVQPASFFGQLGHIEKITLRGAQTLGLRVASGLDQVHRVATIAGDSVLDVHGVREILLIAAALMAHEAAFGILSGIPMEGENKLAGRGSLGVVALRGFLAVDVRLARAVTHFATRHRVYFHGFERCVVGLTEFSEFGFMARLAALRSHIARPAGSRHCRHTHRRRLFGLGTPLAKSGRAEQKHYY